MNAESWNLMMQAGSYLPPHVAPWATWMQICLFLLPFAFIKYWPARILILSQVANTAVAFAVFVYEGHQVTRLFGLGHVAWVLPLVLLVRDWGRRPSIPYRAFIGVAAATISISLLFDARDLALWTAGDRGSVLVGVPDESPLHPSIDAPR